jgi:DNA replication and repair protein RecF
MEIKKLEIRNFRNYEHILISPTAGLNIFAGPNAQGKTNILEAIYLCCVGRSHRTSKDEELIRWGEEYSKITTVTGQRDGTHEVSLLLFRHQKKKKQILISEKKANRIGELFGHVCGILFSPEDLQIVKGGPSERRRYIDMQLSQLRPTFFYNLQNYMKCLEQRNALLREASSQPSMRGMLDDWDEILAKCGAQIISSRREALEELSVRAREEHRMLTGSSEELKLRYSGEAADRDDMVRSLLEGLRKNREDDIRRMTTSIGPHRDDIKIYINGKECKIYASQGQQRSAVLSLRLAQLTYFEKEKKESPILMLDDVMSELDPRRRLCLIERIDQIQTFVTCTDASDIVSSKTGKMYTVHGGKIQSDDCPQNAEVIHTSVDKSVDNCG